MKKCTQLSIFYNKVMMFKHLVKYRFVKVQYPLYLSDLATSDFFCFQNWKFISRLRLEDVKDITGCFTIVEAKQQTQIFSVDFIIFLFSDCCWSLLASNKWQFKIYKIYLPYYIYIYIYIYINRKWTQWFEFKSWTRLFAFHILLLLLGMVWI